MGKRGQNEGSIFKREDGRWCAVLNIGYANGKRRRKYFYGDTRREVQAQLTKALRDQQQGLPVVAERQTVQQFLEQWLRDVVQPNLRPSTYTSYEVLVRVHIVPVLGRIPLAQLTPQQVQDLMTQMRKKGLSERTIQYIRAVLRRALGQALKWGLVARNVAALTDPPRVRRPEVKPWSLEQAKAFLIAVQGDRLEALYAVELALGLRRGEALGLAWDDLDFEQRTLTVRRTLQRVGGQLQLGEPKTATSARTLTLPRELVGMLRAHRVRQLEDRLKAGELWEETGMVFTTHTGRLLEPRNVNHAFARAIERADLPRIRFHDLRHTAISQLIANGTPVTTAQKIAGHSRLSTTADIYTHVVQAQFDEAADRMGALLWGEDPPSREAAR
jgi:integrase